MQEAVPIHRPVDHAGRGEAGDPERGNEGARAPVAVRRVVGHAFAAEAAAVPAQQIRGDAAFIEKHEPVGIDPRRDDLPGPAGRLDIRSVVFGRAYRFF